MRREEAAAARVWQVSTRIRHAVLIAYTADWEVEPAIHLLTMESPAASGSLVRFRLGIYVTSRQSDAAEMMLGSCHGVVTAASFGHDRMRVAGQ